MAQGVIELADRLLKGKVVETITELQAEGASQERIAAVLVERFDIPAHRLMVRRYVKRQQASSAAA